MRRLRLILTVTLLLLLAVAGAGWYLLQDEAFLKARLAAYVLKQTGRELRIDGPLRIDTGRRTIIEASGIHLANADWAEGPDMARVGHFRVVVDIPSLFDDVVVIPQLELDDCHLELVENEKGQNNWASLAGGAGTEPAKPEPGQAGGLPVRLLDNRITRCTLEHRSPQRAQPLELNVERLELQLVNGRRWQSSAAGQVNGTPLSLTGWMEPEGAVLRGEPAEHQLDLQVGQVKLHSEGRVEDASTGAGANLKLRFSGPELAQPLAHLGLPPISDGPFDFRMTLDTQGKMTRVQIRGDLGRMQADAEGQLDRLIRPTQGEVRASVSGPNLEAVGRVFGLDGLLAEPYTLKTAAAFEPGKVRINALNLAVANDTVTAKGVVGTGDALANSDLALTVQSADIGRWSGLWSRPPAPLGELALAGGLTSDASGLFAFTGQLKLNDNTLNLAGPLGFLSGELRSDVNFDLHAGQPQPLAELAGLDTFPDAPLDARGHLLLTKTQARLDDIRLNLGHHRAQLSGTLNPVAPYTGSELSLELDSPNAADLGRLLGQDGWPDAPLALSSRLSRPDRRLRIQQLELKLDGNRLHADGYLRPGEPQLTVDSLNARLISPDLSALTGLFGAADLPSEPIDLSVTLQHDQSGMRFAVKQSATSGPRIEASGVIPDPGKPLLMDADFDVQLAHLNWLSAWKPDVPWPDLPVGFTGRLHNLENRAELQEIKGHVGPLQVAISGNVQADRGFELAVAASGTDAGELKQWLNVELPPDRYTLRAQISGDTARVELAQLEAKLGSSQITGQLQAEWGEQRRITGSVNSAFVDLTPWLAKPETSETGRTDQKATGPYLFDDTPVNHVADIGWGLDLKGQFARVVVGNGEINDFTVGFHLADRRLEVQPFSLVGAAGGRVSGHLVLDTGQQPPQLDVDLRGEKVRIGIASAEGQDRMTLPETDFELRLQGSGRTRREMASGLNGQLRLLEGPGQVAASGLDFLFTDFLMELFDLLNPYAKKEARTNLECAVAAADITSGKVDVYPVVVNTKELTIFSKGTIDLGTERIDLSFNTKPRTGLGITTGVLINPLIKVGGTLVKPAIEFDPKSAIVSSGTAVATAGLSLLAKSFSDRFLSSRDPCGDARKEIEKREQQSP